MSIKNEEIINAISKMNIIDLMDLIKEIEKKFDISTNQLNFANGANKESVIKEEKKEEKTVFTVEMIEFGSNKINVIKTVRNILDLGLKEAKDFVENLPALIKKDIPAVEAEKIKVTLEAAGAKVILK